MSWSGTRSDREAALLRWRRILVVLLSSALWQCGLCAEVESFELDDDRPLVKLFHNKEHNFLACRLFNACMRGTGTMVLPEDMEKHVNALKTCDPILMERLQFAKDPKKMAVRTLGVDLFGKSSQRVHFPHFLHGFVPHIVSLDSVLGDTERDAVSSACIFPNGTEGSCRRYSVTPAVMIEEGLKRPTTPQWIRNFLRLFAPEPSGPLVLDVSDLWSSKGSEEVVCFNSMIVNSKFSGSLQPFLRHHTGFQKHHIDRAPRASIYGSDREGSSCSMRVRILNRKDFPAGETPGAIVRRVIANVKELESTIRDHVAENGRIDLDLETAYFEELNFPEQTAVMQEADVVIAVHGAALTNMIFLREGTQVLELCPFSYFPSLFMDFGHRHLNVSTMQLSAEPDLTSYSSCIHAWVRPQSPDYRRAIESISEYQQAGSAWLAEHRDAPVNMPVWRTDGSKYSFHRTCGRAQRLQINADFVAHRVARIASQVCAPVGS